jgi:ubiquinone/menaquinone biosynthesis C-methylase UbiE
MTVVQFRAGAVPGYDQLVGELTRRLIPTVIQAARLKAGHHVLDIACGTGLAFESASAVVGQSGRITGADISPAMIDAARKRLCGLQNVVLAIEDAQNISFSDASFDAAICNMGLMFFPNPAQAVAELHRVLRPGCYAAVSVNTSPMRSLIIRVLVAIDRHIQPSTARSGPGTFDGSEPRLRSLFEAAGFRNVQTAMETLRVGFPSFYDYFSGVENGTGNVGQEYLTLPRDIRQAVREDVRREIGDSGGPIELDVDITFASGSR